VPRDISIVPVVSNIYFRFLFPMCVSVLVPLAWLMMYLIGSLAAKSLIRVETIRRLTVRYFDVDVHPVLIATLCLLTVLLCVFWVPVGLYAVSML
jgi:hypothetical protein